MKFLNYILSFLLMAGVFIACSEDDLTQLENGQVVAPELTSPTNGEEYILDRNFEHQIATTVNWSEVSYNVDTPLTGYSVEIALAGTNFENPVNITTTLETSFDLTVGVLSSKANEAGLTPEVPGNVELRVSAKLGSGSFLISSAPVTLTVTTYEDVLDLTTPWGIVGSAAPNGWNGPDVPFYKLQGAENQGIIVAYANLSEGEIKFRMNNSWDSPNINYGGESSTAGALIENGPNIAVTAGSYKITMNLNNLTYSIEPYSLGIVGSATPNGWDGPDVQMKYDYTSDQFRTVVKLVDGALKFRMNNDWGTNWGGTDGVLELGGSDIMVTEGNYVITVNFANNTYQLQPLDHIWGLVGSATPNSWDGLDVQLELDYTSDFSTNNGANARWYLDNVALAAGEAKFRADNDWTLNYGGSGLSGGLEEGGGNIVIPSDGSYKVEFNLSTMSYAFTAL